MISNSKWLNSLSSDELTEWLNAEHEPSVKKGLKITFADGGIVESHPLVDEQDNRAKIEADIDTWLGSWTAFSVPLKTVKQAVLCWLDRQAEITEREVKLRELYKFEENHREHIRSIEEVNEKLNQRIAELEAERNELSDELLTCKREYENIQRWLNMARRCHEEHNVAGEFIAMRHVRWQVKRLLKMMEGAE